MADKRRSTTGRLPPVETEEFYMEIDEDIHAVSGVVEHKDFGDLFEQHNHYAHDHGFESDASYNPAYFSLSSNSNSDIDNIIPQFKFEEPEFSDSDE